MTNSQDDSFMSRHKHLLLRAGGGRASKLVAQQPISSLSPTIQAHLKRAYGSLTAYATPPGPNTDNPPLTSYEAFQAWFETPAAAALAPPPNHDLTYPISNYFISSSHNTYLSGNQLYGSASGDAYKNVLLRGCRCLEIDVWDGDEDKPAIDGSDRDETHSSEQKESKYESGRERAHSAFDRLSHRVKDQTDRVKDKAAKMRSPGRSPGRPTGPDNNSGSAEYQTQMQSLRLDVPQQMDVRVPRVEPCVYHGHTLTKDISFREVCHAIKESAFEATDLPIIISLEIHCSLEQQEIMVEIMKTIFKDYLVNISNESESTVDTLPSPDQLRRKILIKVKWIPSSASGQSNNPLDHVQTSETEPTEDVTDPRKKQKATKILKALSELGVYTRAYSFKHFAQPEAKIPVHVFSLSETKVEHFHRDPQLGPAQFEHNRNFLMRVFPSALRIDSSNVDPCFFWQQGAQMVALNWQRLDKGTMLNEGMFAGEEGWVLKPEGFRGVCPKHNDGAEPTSDPRRRLLDLEIEVLAAQNLPPPLGKDASHLPKLKPYVELQLHVDTHGPPGQGTGDVSDKYASLISKYNLHFAQELTDEVQDELARSLKRKSKTARSSDPDFGGEVMEWKGIHDVVDELSFLRLRIDDDRSIGKRDLIAWACIKLNRLKTGYRLVHLLDSSGAPCDSVLLLRISKRMHA